MSWMSGLGWKEGLSGTQLQKVEELERSLTKATQNTAQKQMLIDGLNQSMDKLKRKVQIHRDINIQNDCLTTSQFDVSYGSKSSIYV